MEKSYANSNQKKEALLEIEGHVTIIKGSLNPQEEYKYYLN